VSTGKIIITVDADSMIARAAISEMVRGFENPGVPGVAGNLEIFKRTNLLTRLQALEYIVQIQIVRRDFENFGSLTIAMGAFSAFRKTALQEAGNYDPDYLLEDLKLALYSPLFIIGYKQFLDFTMIKALADIILAGVLTLNMSGSRR
jgi:cellulose synthase/poly-beta-1,6-N-acetylglucosamine synthase-like glycosyltransferase